MELCLLVKCYGVFVVFFNIFVSDLEKVGIIKVVFDGLDDFVDIWIYVFSFG